MATYIVTYDLMKQGQNYTDVIAKLNSYPTHWHAQGSVWIIETQQTAQQIRDGLLKVMDQNDKLFVARLEGEAAWAGYSDKVNAWIKARLEKKVVR